MRRVFALFLAPAGAIAGSASAQELIVQTAVSEDFNRGHNVSVQEQSRPDYSAVGVLIGSLAFYPRVQIGAGATTNTYLTSQNSTAAPFVSEAVSARLETRWTRHSVRISASTTNRQYIGESQRDENLWTINANARLDVSKSIRVDANVTSSQRFENLLTGEVAPTIAALSKYQYSFGSLRSSYTKGRIRAVAAANYTGLAFSTVPLRAGGQLDQNFRDRRVMQAEVQLEYARSSSVALFAQISGKETRYDRPPPSSQRDLDSKSVRFLGGLNADVAGHWRGSIGIGYIVQNYRSAGYKTIRGLAGEVKVDVFPTERLTIGISGRRTIEDVFTDVPVPSFNTGISLRTDYELLRNMILTANGEYVRQSVGRDIIRVTAGGRYLASRRINLQGLLSYSQRSPNSFREARFELSIGYQL